MNVQLVFAAAIFINALALSLEGSRLVAWLIALAGFVYGFALGWWAYGKYHGVF